MRGLSSRVHTQAPVLDFISAAKCVNNFITARVRDSIHSRKNDAQTRNIHYCTRSRRVRTSIYCTHTHVFCEHMADEIRRNYCVARLRMKKQRIHAAGHVLIFLKIQN